MAVHRRIEVTNLPAGAGEVSLVRFLDRKIIDAANIQELGDELFGLVDLVLPRQLLVPQHRDPEDVAGTQKIVRSGRADHGLWLLLRLNR